MTHPSKRGKLICSFVLLRCHEILIASLHHLCTVLTTAHSKNTLKCQDVEIRVKMKVAQLNVDTSAAPENETEDERRLKTNLCRIRSAFQACALN